MPVYRLIEPGQVRTKAAFDKDKSVFKLWVKDSPSILKQALERDLGYWKVPKMTAKDPSDYEECVQIISRHFATLKHMFAGLQSSDNYPYIGWTEFRQFCGHVGILDRTIEATDIDLQFVATKGSAKPDHGLSRHEFLEALTRVANAKYNNNINKKATGRATNFSESLVLLLNSITGKFETKPWQEFRDEALWTTEVDVLLKANLDVLQKVHDQLFPRYGQQGDGLRACLDLVVRRTKLGMTEKVVQFCFAMSKMTVKDEVNNHAEYERLRFPEFLEFLGRVAHARFAESVEAPLEQTLPAVLDAVFGAYGLKRADVEDTDLDGVSSDESLAGFDAGSQESGNNQLNPKHDNKDLSALAL